jgi:hypothetical protein
MREWEKEGIRVKMVSWVPTWVEGDDLGSSPG